MTITLAQFRQYNAQGRLRPAAPQDMGRATIVWFNHSNAATFRLPYVLT